jgi:hypothetical protein
MKRTLLVVLLALGALANGVRAQSWEDAHNRKILLLGNSTDLTHTLTLQAPSLTTAPLITLPGASLTFPLTNGAGVLSNDGFGVLTWAPGGSVTAISIASANGFAGSSSGGTTPALTISTTIVGMLKGNATAISAATSGTDYSAGTSALATGILKSTTTTGALSIAVASDFPLLNQSTTGTAANVTAIVALANGGTGSDNSTGIAQNAVFAGPSTGGAGAASYRALVASDIPSLSATYLPLAGGTMSGDITTGAHNVTGTGTVSASTVNVGVASTTTGTLTLANASSANTTSLQGGNATAAITYTLPTDAGTSGQVLTTTGGAGPNVALSWGTVSGGGSGSGLGATGNTYIARTPTNTSTNSGTTSNTPVIVPGLLFPVAAGQIWSFRMEISATSANVITGIDVGITVPSGGVLEAVAEGLVDLGANGHTTYQRLSSSGQMVGPFNLVALNDAGVMLYGTVDNTNGVAGSVQFQIATPSASQGTQTVYKNSFLTAWQYGTQVATLDQVYTSSTSIVVPTGVTAVYISGIGGAGGGGGGGGKNTTANKNGGGSGGGGGAAEYISTTALTVVPGETLTIVVGTGGAAGSAGVGSTNAAAATGGVGTVSTVSGSSPSRLLFSANGGSGGGAGGNGVTANEGAAGALGAGGVTAGSTPSASGTPGSNGAGGVIGTNSNVTGGAGGSGPTGANANTGGIGGNGGGSNTAATQVNGTAGAAGTGGYIKISY